MLTNLQDAYGHQLYDYFRGKSSGLEIVERDDGFIQANFGPRTYLSKYEDWSVVKSKRFDMLGEAC